MSLTKTLATVLERPNEANFREVTLTPKQEDTVVCKTYMSAISTGTDMKTFHGLQHPEQCWFPLVPGYENMGVILEEGSYAPDLKKGDRVMINECRRYMDVCSAWGGGTLICHKDSMTAGGAGDPLCKIPDNVTDEQAVLAYLATVPLKGIERFDLHESDNILVFGAGMVGISAMQILKIKCPTANIIAVEPHPYRQEIAKFYADHVITPDAAGIKKCLKSQTAKEQTKSLNALATLQFPAHCGSGSKKAVGRMTMSRVTSTFREIIRKNLFLTTITIGSAAIRISR